MGFIKEFKEFALKGNVMDMAVGVIIGGAFGKIVTSLVNNILMPPVAAVMGNHNFADMNVVLKKAVEADSEKGIEAADAVTWNYGAFIQECIDFIIIALCIFMVVKMINKMNKKPEAAPAPAPAPEPTKEEVLLTEIRDLLKEQK